MTLRLPWWAKLSAKLALARIPLPYSFWRQCGLFRHGDMNMPVRALESFDKYFSKAIKRQALQSGFTSLELGPGDSILSGLAARAYGADTVFMVDAGPFADTSVSACFQMTKLLSSKKKMAPDIDGAKTLNEVLQHAHIKYLTEGLRSLKAIPSGSVDFFFSQVVFEHIYRDELPLFLRELRRVVSPKAIGVHSIDFRDHLGGALNNLRFSQNMWESPFFRKSGFYTNRVRPREMLALLSEAGFDVEVAYEMRWPEMPVRRGQLAHEFQMLPDDDFMIAEIEVILRPWFSSNA